MHSVWSNSERIIMQTIKEKGETKVLSGKSENFELMYNEDIKLGF